MRRQLRHLAFKLEETAARCQFQPRALAPTRQPLQQFKVGQYERLVAVRARRMGFREPLDEFPVRGLEQFLFMRRARRQFDDFRQGLVLFTRARTEQKKLDAQPAPRRMFVVRLRAAKDPQRRARGIQMHGRRGKEPALQLLDELLLLLRLLDLGEVVEIGVRQKLGRQGAVDAQKQEGELFQARLALFRQQTRPPILAGKVLPGEREFFKIILQQEPRALGVRADRELGEDFRALGDGLAGIGQFAAQIRPRTVGLCRGPCDARRTWLSRVNAMRSHFLPKLLPSDFSP